jgi:hypothetical protein
LQGRAALRRLGKIIVRRKLSLADMGVMASVEHGGGVGKEAGAARAKPRRASQKRGINRR